MKEPMDGVIWVVYIERDGKLEPMLARDGKTSAVPTAGIPAILLELKAMGIYALAVTRKLK